MITGQSAIGQAFFTLLVDDTEFGRQLDSANKMALERSAVISQSLGTIGREFTMIGEKALGFARTSANAFAESEKSAQRLQESLRIIGQDGEANLGRVNDAIEEMSRRLVIDDEVLSDSFSALSQRTNDTATALELVGIAADIAAAKGKPLETVVQAVGRAYQGSTLALERMGVVMDENLQGIDQLREAGARFAGAAERDAGRHGKAWERISIAWENIQEKFGSAMAPTLTKLAERVSVVLDRINKLSDATLTAYGNGLIWVIGIGLIGGKLLELTSIVMQVIQAVKLYQLAQVASASATGAAQAANVGFVGSIRAIPPAAAAAVVAIGLLIAAYNDLRKAQQGLNDAASMAPGAENLIGTELDATGNTVYQREGTINDETQREGELPLAGLFGWLTGANAQVARAGKSAKGAQDKLREIREMRRPHQAPSTAPWMGLPEGYGPGHAAPGNFSDMIKNQQQFSY